MAFYAIPLRFPSDLYDRYEILKIDNTILIDKQSIVYCGYFAIKRLLALDPSRLIVPFSLSAFSLLV